jgi:hypothetical protein
MYRAVDAVRSTAASVRFQGAMFLKGPVWGLELTTLELPN